MQMACNTVRSASVRIGRLQGSLLVSGDAAALHAALLADGAAPSSELDAAVVEAQGLISRASATA